MFRSGVIGNAPTDHLPIDACASGTIPLSASEQPTAHIHNPSAR